MNTLVNGKSSKYVTAYPYDSAIDKGSNDLNKGSEANYLKNVKIYGDTIRETTIKSVFNGIGNWYDNFNSYLVSYECFFLRGGCLWNSMGDGMFAVTGNGGWYQNEVGFRSVLVSK